MSPRARHGVQRGAMIVALTLAALQQGIAAAPPKEPSTAPPPKPMGRETLPDPTNPDQRAAKNGSAVRGKPEATTANRTTLEKAAAFAELAAELNDSGAYEDAEQNINKALDIHRRLLGELHTLIGRDLNLLGRILQNQNRYAEAEETLRAAVTFHEAVDGANHLNTAESVHLLAQTLRGLGRYADAEPLARRALAIRQTAPGIEKWRIADSLHWVGVISLDQDHLDEAEALTRRALAIYDEVFGRDSDAAAWSVNNLGVIQDRRGAYAEAETSHREVLRIRTAVFGERHREVSHAKSNIAWALKAQGKLTEAERLFRDAFSTDLALLGDDHVVVAKRKADLADILWDQGAYAESERYAWEAFHARRRHLGDDHPVLAESNGTLACLVRVRGEYDQAERFARKALEIDRRAFGDEHVRVAYRYHMLAWTLYEAGDYASADPMFRRALGMYRRFKGEDHPAIAELLFTYGPLLLEIGDCDGASGAFREALRVRIKTHGDSHWCVAEGTQHLGRALGVCGELKEAEKLLRSADAMLRALLEPAHPSIANCLYDLGVVLQKAGRIDEAELCLREALERRQAVYSDRSPMVAKAMLALANLEVSRGGTEHLRAAEKLLQRSTHLLREAHDPSLHVACTRYAGLLATKPERRDDAIRLYEEAVTEIEHRRTLAPGDELARARYLSELVESDPFGGIARVLLEGDSQKAARRALQYVERGRGRALLELMERGGHSSYELALGRTWQGNGVQASDLERARKMETSAQARRAAIEASFNSVDPRMGDLGRRNARPTKELEVKLDRLREQERSSSFELAEMIRTQLAPEGLVPATTLELAGSLSEGELLLMYDLGKKDSLLFVLTSDARVSAHPLTWPDGEAVTATAVGEAVQHVIRKSSRGFAGAGEPGRSPSELGHALFPPSCRDTVLSARRLRIVPHGSLHQLPFDVLPMPGTDGLLADVAPPIHYGPSATVLKLCQERKRKRHGAGQNETLLVVLGDVPYESTKREAFSEGPRAVLLAQRGSRDFGPLPGTRSEALWVSRTVRQNVGTAAPRIHVLLGHEATKKNLLQYANQPRFLHLATHGDVVGGRRAYETALALAPPPGSDADDESALLLLGDILRDWPGKLQGTELVVLSSCHSAGGTLETADGIVALTWGFLYAGAESVLASLWSVDDISTAILMRDFYRNLLEQGMSKSEALSRAKQSLRRMTLAEVEELVGDSEPLFLASARGRVGKVRYVRSSDRPFADPYFWAPFVLIGAD